MRLHRFYLPTSIQKEKIVINDERLIHQWRNVFRYNVGSEIILFDGTGYEYGAILEKLSNREAEVQVVSKRESVLPSENIILFQSLIKRDKMEWVVEKATELGVSKMVPIVSERSEKKGLNMFRANKIAVEASEQCGRGDVPEILEVMSLEEALENVENVVVFDKEGTTPPLAPPQRGGEPNKNQVISIFIGPEGGWSPREMEMFKKIGAKVYSLGALTLRAETAAIAALSWISLQR